MDLDELALSDKVIAGSGIVLIVDLVFLPWHSIDLGLLTWSRSGIEPPNALSAVLALLVTVAAVAVTLLRALKPGIELPDLPVSWDRATFLGAAAALGLLVLKLALDTDRLGIGAWLGLLLAAAMTYGGYLKLRTAPGGHVAE
jgi:hypothetical protein